MESLYLWPGSPLASLFVIWVASVVSLWAARTAMNVKRLGSDNANPSVFRKRMSAWERRVMQSGGLGWRTFMNASKLADYLGEVRASAENRRHASARPEGASA